MKTNILLDEIAKRSIPEGQHQLLRVDCREAWIKMVSELIKTEKVELTPKNIQTLSKNWEPLLITKYSALN